MPYPGGHVLLYESTIPGIVTVNMTNVIDIDGAKTGVHFANALKEYELGGNK